MCQLSLVFHFPRWEKSHVLSSAFISFELVQNLTRVSAMHPVAEFKSTTDLCIQGAPPPPPPPPLVNIPFCLKMSENYAAEEIKPKELNNAKSFLKKFPKSLKRPLCALSATCTILDVTLRTRALIHS